MKSELFTLAVSCVWLLPMSFHAFVMFPLPEVLLVKLKSSALWSSPRDGFLPEAYSA